jgi:branched-chain amino acid transport system permease protein
MTRQLRSFIPLVAIIVVAALIGGTFSPSGQLDVTTGLVEMCMVVGLYAFIGVTGVSSFGHIGFVAVGAYVSGVLAVPLAQKELFYSELPGFLASAQLSPLVAILVGGVGAALVGAVLAPASGRLSGLSAALATFAMLVIVHVIARNYEPLTRGTKGMIGVPQETTLWRAAVWAIIFVAVVQLFQSSRVGLQLRAAREDDVAASSVGVRVGTLRGGALILSAFLVGIAGGVYGQMLGSFNPDVFYLDLTFLTLAMLVVGGITTLSGAVIGSLVVTFMLQGLRHVEASVGRPGLTEVCFALVTILILVMRPSGLTGGRELSLPRRLRPRPRGEAIGG